MSEEPQLPKQPLYLISKIVALLTSSVLYSVLLTLMIYVGCQGYNPLLDDARVDVDFVEDTPRTLEESKEGGNEPEKPDEPVEVIPPRAVEEAPETVVRKPDQTDAIPAAIDVPAPRLMTSGITGRSGQGIIGDRSKGGREDGIARRGGSAAAENSVRAALRWLAAHQDKDGKWSVSFAQHCPSGDRCGRYTRPAHKGGPYSVGLTGLATLAFLGHGNTHKEGEYREVVNRALRFLIDRQNARTGAFNSSSDTTFLYDQGIATLALAEVYAMSKDKSLRRPLIRAVGYICQAQQQAGGWDYTARRTGRNDTSVTGWQVMALKSAHSAGIKIPWKTTHGVLKHFERVTDEFGRVGYKDRATSSRGVALTAVGMLSNLYTGLDRKDAVIRRQKRILLQNLPSYAKLKGRNRRSHSMYYWYYGTLAMYQHGGAEWDKWNGAIRDMLVRTQCTKGHKDGSWEPDGFWARPAAGGRIYSTTLMTLTLEVYYRYLPMYETKDHLGASDVLVEMLSEERNPTKRVAILRKLVAFKEPTIDKILKDLLKDKSPVVRFSAAKHLAQRGNPEGIPFLAKGIKHSDAFYRHNAIAALEELDHVDTIPPLIRALRDELAGNANRAARALQKKTGADFGFNMTTDRDERRKIIASWLSWWENNRRRLSTVPDIVGEVVASMDRGRKVLVKVGPNDPIKKGMEFKVFRSGILLGRLKIIEVLKGGSAEATVTNWTVPQASIRRADKIATRELPREKKVD